MAQFSLACLLSLLTHQLASPHFPARERASQTLAAALPLSLPYLATTSQSDDLETRLRATAILRHWQAKHARQLAATLLPHGWTHMPYIDCGPPGMIPGNVQTIHVNQAVAELGFRDGFPEWKVYRVATSCWLRCQLEEGESPELLQRQLDLLARGEVMWWRDRRKGYWWALRRR
jgi:hypothetical protein